jgi:glutamate/aspartate transport system permease protein
MELIINGFITTATITTVALVFGLLLGTVLAMCRTLRIPVADQLARVYIDTFRSLPLVLIIFGFYLVAPGIVKSMFGINGDIRMACALVAFSLFEAAYFAEIIRSGFNAIPKNQLAACKSNGFSTFQSYRYVLIPQAINNSLPVLVTQGIVLFQDTALVYVIGLTDFFGSMVKVGEMNGNMPGMILAGSAAYLVLCVALQRVANRLQRGAV